VLAQRDGVEALCRHEHAELVRSLTLYTGDPLLAEERAQVSGMASPEGWLHRVGFNHANACFQRRRADGGGFATAEGMEVSGAS
jgi:hypothetical protein